MQSSNPPNARDTSIADMQAWVDRFADERQWERYHTPKNLAMSIAIEAAEIMELYQWSSNQACDQALANESPLAEELADVLSYVLRLASVTGIDLAVALSAKMAKNALKYPVNVEHRFPSSGQ
jgi:NTP pyrophosphatase (non-canonical NTP hydrolase)